MRPPVARQIKELVTLTGANTFFDALEHGQVMHSQELFTKHVAPELPAFEIDALNYPEDAGREVRGPEIQDTVFD